MWERDLDLEMVGFADAGFGARRWTDRLWASGTNVQDVEHNRCPDWGLEVPGMTAQVVGPVSLVSGSGQWRLQSHVQ